MQQVCVNTPADGLGQTHSLFGEKRDNCIGRVCESSESKPVYYLSSESCEANALSVLAKKRAWVR